MVGWWFGMHGVNRIIIHFFKAFIPLSRLYSFYHFLQNHPGGKYQHIVRQGIESILSPKQQRRPLPSLLSLSFFYALLEVFRLCRTQLLGKITYGGAERLFGLELY